MVKKVTVSDIYFSKKIKSLLDRQNILKKYCEFYQLSPRYINSVIKIENDFNFGDHAINELIDNLFFSTTNNFSEILLSKFTGIGAKFIDRSLVKIPFLDIPNYAFVDLYQAIEERVNFFKSLSNSKKIILLWSGGIDSTLAFYALMNSNISFLVCCDENSEKEYPLLFNQIINNKFPNIDFIYYDRECFNKYVFDKNYVFITGELGDQTLGSMVTMNFDFTERQMTLSEAIDKNIFLNQYNKQNDKNENIPIFTKEIVKFCANGVSKVIQNYDLNQNTVSEFLWAENFVYKYSIVFFRLLKQNLIPCGPDTNVYHFYSSELFQQYALSHYKENCYFEKLSDYKISFKQLIFEYNKDKEYLNNKIKVPSLKDSNFYNQ